MRTEPKAVYYKARLSYEPSGMVIVMDEFRTVHSTNCYDFCLKSNGRDFKNANIFKREGETIFQSAKRQGIKIHRIDRSGSRIAQPTKEEAFTRFKFLKSRQMRHLQRDVSLIGFLIDKISDKPLSSFNEEICKYNHTSTYEIKDSESKLREYFIFD